MPRYAPGRSRRFRTWFAQQKRRQRKQANQAPTGDFALGDWNPSDWSTTP